MSIKFIGQVWDLDLPHSLSWILMALADHADHDGVRCWPSVELIGWKTGYSRRQVQRLMRQLQALGILVLLVERKGFTSVYGIDFSTAKRKPPLVRDLRHPGTGDKMSPVPQLGHGGCAIAVSPGVRHPDDARTVIKPSENLTTSPSSMRKRPNPPAAPNGGDGGGEDKKTLIDVLRSKPGAEIPWAKIAKAARHPTDTALAVLSACGCPVAKHQANEWLTVCWGSQIGALIAIANWRRSIGEPIRQPSGLRRAIEVWHQLPISDRKAMAAHVASCLAGAA